MPNDKHIPLSDYFDKTQQPVFTQSAVPNYSRVDFNLEFLRAKGWSVSADRFDFTSRPMHDRRQLINCVVRDDRCRSEWDRELKNRIER